MLTSTQNSNDLPNTIWVSVPKGVLAGAVSAVCIGAVAFPPLFLLLALFEGQWFGYRIRPDLGPLDLIWWLWGLYGHAGFSRYWPIYAVIGSISGSLGSAIGALSRSRKYAVVTGVASGVIISPLIAANVYNNLGGFFLWYIFVGALAGLLGTLYAGTVTTIRKGYLFALLLIVLAVALTLLYMA
jgi:hypothetical protein